MKSNVVMRLKKSKWSILLPLSVLVFVGGVVGVNATINIGFLGFNISASLLISYGFFVLAFVFAMCVLIIHFRGTDIVAKERSKVNWQMEEVRGIFVLGIIATLWTLRQVPEVVTGDPTGGIFLVIINLLTVSWGAYIFLMAIAIPSDDFDERIAVWSKITADVLFFGGALVMPNIALIAVLLYLLHGFQTNPLFPFVVAAIMVPSGLLTGWLFSPHKKARAKRPSQIDSKIAKNKTAKLRLAKK